MTPILIDTSFLYALNDVGDRNRAKAREFAQDASEYLFLVPKVVLTETAFILQKHVSELALFNFWESLNDPQIGVEVVVMK